MKLRTTCLTLPAAALASTAAQTASAQTNTNLYPVTFRAVCTSTNRSGIFQEVVLNTNLVTDCAADHNITNLDSLRLVFNRTNSTLQVVSNNTVVCTSFTFTGGLTFTNTNNTQIVFQKNVLVGTNLTASGVVFGSANWNPTNYAGSFGLRATLLYTEPAAGTNAPALCQAVLRVGTAINTQEDEDNDNDNDNDHGPGEQNHENNGNHYGWQNPKNPHSSR